MNLKSPEEIVAEMLSWILSQEGLPCGEEWRGFNCRLLKFHNGRHKDEGETDGKPWAIWWKCTR